MSSSTLKQLPKSTVELEIRIPWEEIKTSYEKILDRVISESELPGFRKGKAPKDLVIKDQNRSKLYEEVVREVMPKVYRDEIQKYKLSPVISPKVEVLEAKEGKEWVIKASVALKPSINLKNYKEKIREFKKSKVKIWTPGKSHEKDDQANKKINLDELLNVILSTVEFEISDMIDQTHKLGLSVEQYLLAKGKTTEGLRSEYAEQALKNLKTEFALNEIADGEKITVTQEDIDKLLKNVEKTEEREKLKKESYYLAHLIRQQKTLDFLNNL